MPLELFTQSRDSVFQSFATQQILNGYDRDVKIVKKSANGTGQQ
jgi:hypothetical protein